MSKSLQSFGIHWFRRDLRVAGNPALKANFKRHEGRVVGLFCFDSVFLSRPDFSHNRFAFFLGALAQLQKEMRELGSDLLIVDSLAQKAFPQILKIKSNYELDLVTWNRDYEPFARTRDKDIEVLLQNAGVESSVHRDHLLIEPEEIFKTQPGDYYQVYSPFARKWFDFFDSKEVQARLQEQQSGLDYLEKASQGRTTKMFNLSWKDVLPSDFPLKDQLIKFTEENQKSVTIPIPKAGSLVAYESLKDFAGRLKNYKEDRDIPSVNGTSHFSLFLKNGSITTAQIIQYLKLNRASFKVENSQTRFVKELAWREFYYHILYHRPDVETQSFLEKYRKIKWPNDKKLFAHWCEGTTGFPLVDAGMRQLNTTGWMHNRVRMVVSSFLIKDLLVNWQWGENYFMKMLLDGDLAPNNGGWQWAASTGCDPQPYFRIFNPWLQSAKFDPQAEYIKTYIPELKDISAKEIHKPDGDRGSKYPQPIVDHAYQKRFALQLYTN